MIKKYAVNDPDNVRWEDTIMHYAVWTDPEEQTGERELKIKDNSKIKVKWIKNYGHI